MLSDGCRMSDRGMQLVSRRCPELTHLQVQYCVAVTNRALFDLVTKCSNLQHLDITGNTKSIRPKCVHEMAKLTQYNALNRLLPSDHHQFQYRIRSAAPTVVTVFGPD